LDAYNKGQFALAADYFRMILHATPSDWNAQFYLGMALAQNMQTKAAQIQFRSISELCPDATMRRRATLAESSLRSFTA
jgi:Flp pilus assembly protein TadD